MVAFRSDLYGRQHGYRLVPVRRGYEYVQLHRYRDFDWEHCGIDLPVHESGVAGGGFVYTGGFSDFFAGDRHVGVIASICLGSYGRGRDGRSQFRGGGAVPGLGVRRYQCRSNGECGGSDYQRGSRAFVSGVVLAGGGVVRQAVASCGRGSVKIRRRNRLRHKGTKTPRHKLLVLAAFVLVLPIHRAKWRKCA
jgi:hypothetical protein